MVFRFGPWPLKLVLDLFDCRSQHRCPNGSDLYSHKEQKFKDQGPKTFCVFSRHHPRCVSIQLASYALHGELAKTGCALETPALDRAAFPAPRAPVPATTPGSHVQLFAKAKNAPRGRRKLYPPPEEHLALLLWKINVEIDSFRANVRIKGFWKFIIETYI